MAYRITTTADAAAQFRWLTAREQRIVEAAVHARLVDQPKTETRAVKKLRPNPQGNRMFTGYPDYSSAAAHRIDAAFGQPAFPLHQ